MNLTKTGGDFVQCKTEQANHNRTLIGWIHIV